MAGFQLQLFLSPLTLGEKGYIFKRKSSFKLSHSLVFKVLVANIQALHILRSPIHKDAREPEKRRGSVKRSLQTECASVNQVCSRLD